MRIKSYLQAARRTPYRMSIVVAQVVVFLVMFAMFVVFLPWITSSEISEIGKYDRPTPPPPPSARAFTVGHGVFTYYRESTADNPVKYYAIVVPFFCLWVFLIGSGIWITTRPPKRRSARQQATHGDEPDP